MTAGTAAASAAPRQAVPFPPFGEAALPPLRDDLALFAGPPEADGAPSWTIYDPVRHRYFRIGWAGFACLARWHLGTAAKLLHSLADETTLELTPEAFAGFVLFLRGNSLLRGDDPASVAGYAEQAKAARLSWPRWLLHNYLFIRVPLVRPDRFVAATLPAVRLLVLNRRCALLTLLLGGLGLLLAARQWESFVHTFLHFFSIEGMLYYGAALAATKVLHEFGHAYAAKRFGCRVGTMGIAFLVLWPVLYTDVTDAWRLVSRRQRLLIAAAGMMTELGLALIATLLWSFLPDGPARSAAFLVATVTWVATLLINLSPFMRFDGYYLLSDGLGVPNLQDRAFALGRWRLRELLFGFGDPPPEVFVPRLHRVLLLYAYATWIYRLFLFFGIALLVYHFFFKLLGIFLMMVELSWFIARPVLREAAAWWGQRRALRPNRQLAATLAVSGLLVWLAVTPWNSAVLLPAVLHAAAHAVIYPPAPARIAEMRVAPGRRVEAGEVLYVLEAPELDYRLAQARGRLALLQHRIQRQAANPEDLEHLQVLQQQLATVLSSETGLLARRAALVLRAPFDGVVADLPPVVRPGLWVKVDQELGRIIGPERAALRGYVEGGELHRIVPGDAGWFYPEDPQRPPVAVAVVEVDQVNAATFDSPWLASTQGGAIAVQPDTRTGLVPVAAVYRVTLEPRETLPAPDQVIRGTVRIEGEARSFADRAWRAAAAVLIRESGF